MEQRSRLTVGEVDGNCAVLASDDLHVVRLPLALLPEGVAIGHVIDLVATRSVPAEQARDDEIRRMQAELQARLGPAMPTSAASVHDILSS